MHVLKKFRWRALLMLSVLLVFPILWNPRIFGLVKTRTHIHFPVDCSELGDCKILWGAYQRITTETWRVVNPFGGKNTEHAVSSATMILPDNFKVQIDEGKFGLGRDGEFKMPIPKDSAKVRILDEGNRCIGGFTYYPKRVAEKKIIDFDCD